MTKNLKPLLKCQIVEKVVNHEVRSFCTFLLKFQGDRACLHGGEATTNFGGKVEEEEDEDGDEDDHLRLSITHANVRRYLAVRPKLKLI